MGGGAAHTNFWVDLQKKLIGIFMDPVKPYSGLKSATDFRQLTNAALSSRD